jgi:F-type H+-transporting ATPase subunit alpha
LDKATQDQLDRGARIAEVLKQPQNSPLPLPLEIAVLWAALRGHLDGVPIADVARFEREWIRYLEASHPDIGAEIALAEDLTAATEARLDSAVGQFKALFLTTGIPV